MTADKFSTLMRPAMQMFVLMAAVPIAAMAQRGAIPPDDSARIVSMADHAMSGPMDTIMMRHMELTPVRTPTHADSVRAMEVAAELKRAIAKYQDTAVAVVDGYKMFAPKIKNQPVFHFTKSANAIGEVFRFNSEKPTSLLYKRAADGTFHLVGAMYIMPKRARLNQLNDRIPLSIARWHKHVNWCVPKLGEQSRWAEQHQGLPVFGPASPIATKELCDAVHGTFHESPLGWMVHANVYEGTDLATIWGDEHGMPAGHSHP
jgi:hypothetical protein